eukprot:TRINITY_DN16168_c0_g4_i1.p1 TRINITY_DN16168_c0_g4~~TRINITY_DN16168_c0_g4_i1.p1  ORF type:complete len:274 (+),score=34.72 TRINITY_DN16168_c0_g4_i1:63-884(+)
MASAALIDSDEKGTSAPKLWCGCIDCANFFSWRNNTGNRQCWKIISTISFCAIIGCCIYARKDSPVMMAIGVLYILKNMVAIWGQDTPTWIVPGSIAFFIVIYVLGLPSVMFVMVGCPGNSDISFPYKDIIGFMMFVFGLTYSFAYEYGRMQWKKLPENKGRCHTVGLASLSIHPNYFGDLFTYSGWAIASGSICALSISTAQVGGFLWFIIPNSDAYLAERYQADFPSYAAKTAPLIPFLTSPMLNQIVACLGFGASFVASAYCTTTCSADS